MSRKPFSTDVLVIGGGIAGTTLASLLGNAGIDVHLVEPFPPSPLSRTQKTGRTVALMGGSCPIIHAAGVGDIIEPLSCPIETMQIIDASAGPDEELEAEFPAQDIGRERFGINVPNAILRAALFETATALPTVTPHTGFLESYDTTPHAVTATLDTGVTIKAKLLIGVDGRKSKVRELANIKTRNTLYGQSAITCIVNHSRSHNNTATEFHRPAGPLAFVPMPGNRSSVVWVEKTPHAEQVISLRKQDFIQRLQDLSQDTLGGLTLETGPECWPLGSIRATELTAPRVALAAEAAHVMSPITAQGLNLSLRDIAALAETIADFMRAGLDPGSKAALSRYERRRRMDIRTRVFGVDAMNRIVSTDHTLLKRLRRFGLKSVDLLSPLRTFAMEYGLTPKLDQGRLARGKVL